MKTPFDSALRVERREMDKISIGLRAENEALSTMTAACATLEARFNRESEIAATEVSVVSYAFADRLRAQRRGLRSEQLRASERLDALRDIALAASGRLRAIEVAAEDFDNCELRRENGLVQSESDDLAGARMAYSGALQRRLVLAAFGR